MNEPNTMTTTEDIFSILAQSTARADAATKGPWLLDTRETPNEISICDQEFILFTTATNEYSCDMKGQKEDQIRDSDFVCRARTDLPARDAALKVAVEALQEMADEASRNNAWYQCSHWLDAEEALTKVLAILKGGQA